MQSSSTSKGSGYCRSWTGFGEEEYPNNKCMEGAIEPADWNDQEPPGNVAGCGLLLDSQNQWAIFTTLNGTLLGQFRITFLLTVGVRIGLKMQLKRHSNSNICAPRCITSLKMWRYQIILGIIRQLTMWRRQWTHEHLKLFYWPKYYNQKIKYQQFSFSLFFTMIFWSINQI
jgi:hypothetical protein